MFNIAGSPSDSNNSTNSSSSDAFTSIHHKDLYDIAPIAIVLLKRGESKVSPYRRYIENVLKTRALKKSFTFLKNLHENILEKSRLTLIHWKDEQISSKVCTITFDLLNKIGYLPNFNITGNIR